MNEILRLIKGEVCMGTYGLVELELRKLVEEKFTSTNTGSHAIRTLLERYKVEELEPSDNTQLLDWFVEWCEQQASA